GLGREVSPERRLDLPEGVEDAETELGAEVRGKDETSLTVQHERLHRQILRDLDRRPRRKPSKTAATRQSCATNALRAQFWARVSPCTVPTASAARWLLRSTRGPRRCRPSGRTPPSPERERF